MTHDTGKISDSWQVIPTIKHRKLQTTCRLLRIGCVARNLNILCKCIFPACFEHLLQRELSISVNYKYVSIYLSKCMCLISTYITYIYVYMNDSSPEHRLRVALQMPSRSLIFGRIGFCMNLAFVAEEKNHKPDYRIPNQYKQCRTEKTYVDRTHPELNRARYRGLSKKTDMQECLA